MAEGNGKQARDLYERVTADIVAVIEQGASTFQMPWYRSGIKRPVNASTQKRYHGVNVLGLWAAAQMAGYSSGYWATYKQWKELGAQVRRGERASLIVFYKKIEQEIRDQEEIEDGSRKTYLLIRPSMVFNASQVDGWTSPKPEIREPAKLVAQAETFMSTSRAQVRHGGDRAYYAPVADYIQLPDRERFTGSTTSSPTESYYATALHELTHWTGHETRLDRKLALSKRFGDEAYAMEELVAELGAAFLCCDLGITNTPRPDHAAYIAKWLRVLKTDKKAIFAAASKASQAHEYLLGLQVR